MAHFKRKKPKRHTVINCCWYERDWVSGNHKFRATIRDLKQPQMNTRSCDPWRYKNVIGSD